MRTNNTVRILLVEDDVNLGYLLVENLKAKNFDVVLAETGKAATEEINKAVFDICLLDIMLPGIDGFTVAERIREKCPGVPFIFLTARSQEKDRIHGFEAGADDYITKPFSFKELYYRILVALRRKNIEVVQPVRENIVAGSCTLNAAQRTLRINDSERKLSQREFELLAILMQHTGNYVSRSEILKQVWGRDDYFTAKSMDVYITRIRKLIKDDITLEIENLYGTGYRIRQLNAAFNG